MPATDRIDPNLLKNVKNLSPEQQREILALLDELEDAEKKAAARDGFLGFISWHGLLSLRAGITRSWQMPLSVLPTGI